MASRNTSGATSLNSSPNIGTQPSDQHELKQAGSSRLSPLKNIWSKLRRIFDFSKPSNAPLDPAKVKEDKSNESDVHFEELSKHFEFEANVFPGMSDDLRNQVNGIMVKSWNLGLADGVLGQKQMPQAYFRVHAEQLRDQLLFFLKSKKVPAQKAFEERRSLFEKSKEILEQAQNYRNDATIRRQTYPRNYSASLAWLYLIVAGLLLLADIPLALMITRVIFRIAPPDKWHDIQFLFFKPPGDPLCDSLPAHIWYVVTGNWQIVLMTIGVALCAIYFKIFYDDLMGFSPDKAVRQFRDLGRNNQADDETTKKKEERMTHILYGVRTTVKFFILAFVVYTIVWLGFVRAAAEDVQAAAESKKIENVSSAPSEWQDVLPPAVTPTDSSADIQKAEEKLRNLKEKLFILLTILLPFMAGICFSLGMSNFHNRKEVKHAENLYWQKLDEYNKALTAQSEAQMQDSIFQEFIDKCGHEDFVRNYETSFFNCYLHGYQRGVVSPDKDLDMYERAKKFRDRLLATKSIQAIQRANETVKYVDPITPSKN